MWLLKELKSIPVHENMFSLCIYDLTQYINDDTGCILHDWAKSCASLGSGLYMVKFLFKDVLLKTNTGVLVC